MMASFVRVVTRFSGITISSPLKYQPRSPNRFSVTDMWKITLT